METNILFYIGSGTADTSSLIIHVRDLYLMETRSMKSGKLKNGFQNH